MTAIVFEPGDGGGNGHVRPESRSRGGQTSKLHSPTRARHETRDVGPRRETTFGGEGLRRSERSAGGGCRLSSFLSNVETVGERAIAAERWARAAVV